MGRRFRKLGNSRDAHTQQRRKKSAMPMSYTTNQRNIDVTLSGGQLMAKIIGAAAVDGGEMRPLIPLSQTPFEGLGIAIDSSSTIRASRRMWWRFTPSTIT
jgi:hypothetical protein